MITVNFTPTDEQCAIFEAALVKMLAAQAVRAIKESQHVEQQVQLEAIATAKTTPPDSHVAKTGSQDEAVAALVEIIGTENQRSIDQNSAGVCRTTSLAAS